MTRTTIALALFATLTAASACKKKDEGGTAAKTTEAAKPADTAAAKPADPAAKPADPAAAAPAADPAAAPAGKPLEMEAPALFTDYNKPGQDPMALLDKWKPGVIVTGVVENVITEEAGNSSIFVTSAPNTKMSLGFTDNGKAVKDKGVKKGDKVTAQCSVGGSDEHLMMLIDCALK